MKVGRDAGGVEVADVVVAVEAAAQPPAKRRRVAAAAGAGGRRVHWRRGGRRRVQAEASPVQRLFQACRAVFGGPGTVPAPAEVDLLCAMLDRMRPEDVGLSADQKFFRNRDASEGTPTITYTTLYQLRLAKLVVDDVFTAPCDTSVLYPTTGGNMHRFRAIAPCAILDVLGPPYSIEEDRDCTYYTEIPNSYRSMTNGADSDHLGGIEQEGSHLAWLKEIDMPRDLTMRSVRYGGPPISDK